MIPLRRFEIHQPASVQEASQMLAEFGEEASLYAGGTELLLAMKLEVLRYKHLVDVKLIPGLDCIEAADGVLHIGATTTHRSLERSALVRRYLPVLVHMERRVANVRVRNSGTWGGNLCFAEPHSDPATLLLALGATVSIARSAGMREVGIEEFLVGPYQTCLTPGEVLTGVHVPILQPDQRAAYMRFQVHERPALGLALVLRTPDQGKTISEARLAIGCVCLSPRRSSEAERLLTGSRSELEPRLPEIAQVLGTAAELSDDRESTAEYKQNLVRVFLKRALMMALESN